MGKIGSQGWVVTLVMAIAVAGACGPARPGTVPGPSFGAGLAADAPIAGASTTVSEPTPAAEPAVGSSVPTGAEVPGGQASPPAPPPTPPVPTGPVVKQPPPRPNRSSEAPTRQDPPPALTPGSAPPATTVRYPQDFPDPFVFRAGAFWYALSTQRGLNTVPVIRSADLVHWEDRGNALPRLPGWSRFGATWAPSVLAVPGGFVLYYTAADATTGLQCLSQAFSPLPDGPYVDVSTGPFICQTDRGGSIDSSPFRDEHGRPWLTWKSEGTLDGEPTRLWSQPLADDGRSLLGAPAELLHTAEAWEGPIIEAPSMVHDASGYHLFYSGNRWETAAYGVGHARCAGPAGPCARLAREPVLRPHASEAGPGGGEVFRDLDGSLKLAYHAWDPLHVGYPDGFRTLRIGAVGFGSDGRATVEPIVVG